MSQIIIPYKGKLNHCKLCGSYAIIRGWEDGIGDVECSNRECMNSTFYRGTRMKPWSNYHYSGKFRTRKSEAIRRWNRDNA